MRSLGFLTACLLAVTVQARGLGPVLDNPELNLSSEQQQKISQLLDKERLDCVQLRADLEKARLQMEMAIKSEASLSSLENQVDEISKAEAKLEKAHLRTRVEVRRLLDDSQKQIFDRMHGPRGKGRKGGRGGHGPGFGAGFGPGCGPGGFPGAGGPGCGPGPCGPGWGAPPAGGNN